VKSIKRRDFSKIPSLVSLPNLLEVQTDSYEAFLQSKGGSKKRRVEGLEEVFREIFPVDAPKGKYSLEYLNYQLGDPRYTIEECQDRDMTFSASLRADLRLIIREEDERGKRVKNVVEQNVYLGEVPLMTEKGTFVINGAERVIVSQLHRSPGAFFDSLVHPTGKKLYTAQMIPYRGSWIEFSVDINDILYCSIDKRRRFFGTVLLKALGYSDNSSILKLFFKTATERLGGRKAEDLMTKTLAVDVVDPNTGEVLAEAGTELTSGLLTGLEAVNIKAIEVLDAEGDDVTVLRNTLRGDTLRTSEDALLKIYNVLHPGEAAPAEVIKNILERMFFDKRRYDLKKVGRFRLNERLSEVGKRMGIRLPEERITLCPEDFLVAISYLLGLSKGKGFLDDIDHLGNRRVLCVGELVANQFSIAFSRMARMVKEKMAMADADEPLTPQDLVNSRIVSSVINTFFGSSQLSQFLDQPNPLAELRHKRRLSALGPGGLTRERAGFEVRDVHYTHYGRICPIETPEGPNIGLISSLSTYARVNEYGFIETPYRKVKNGKATEEIEYLTADVEDRFTVAQANSPLGPDGRFLENEVLCRRKGDFPKVSPKGVDFMDISPKQLVSVSAALIPFLEHDDANRALMGSNMQCQAVPLIKAEPPIMGTGIEGKVAVDAGGVIVAKRDGVVEKVTAEQVLVVPTKRDPSQIILTEEDAYDVYKLIKFRRSNQDTSINYVPIVREGESVKKGDILADGPATQNGELSLGINCLAAFMPWGGYNFEDAIVISERLISQDKFTSIHIEEFATAVRQTKRGPEEITREIPNVGEDALKNLDEDGIVRIGAQVKTGDIIVGKVSPKGETELSSEERLLRAIFGEKAGDVKDTSLRASPGMDGIVVDVKVFARRATDRRSLKEEARRIEEVEKESRRKLRKLREILGVKLSEVLEGEVVAETVRSSDEVVLRKGERLSPKNLEDVPLTQVDIAVESKAKTEEVLHIKEMAHKIEEALKRYRDNEIDKIKRGDELPTDVLKMVKVFISRRRKLQVGDKLAGRHGNKGVLARILPEEEMPFLEDGTPVDIILNPLGVPSRMNVGQILETHLGWAAKLLGYKVATPVFEGATLREIQDELVHAKLPSSGKVNLRDGRTGEFFLDDICVGQMYMFKLSHLVDDKIHARSTGPYSLVTQQPLGGKSHFGGQRFGEMEVWALEAYGAAHILQELLTVKSDDVMGRTRLYEAIVKGENPPEPGIPASFDVLIKELQGLCLDVQLEKD